MPIAMATVAPLIVSWVRYCKLDVSLTFNGALAVALSEGRPLSEAVRFATAASAIAVTRMGAQSAVPMREEVDALLAEV